MLRGGMESAADLPLIERHPLVLLAEALDDFRVVILNGARQSGKTTLLKQLHASRGGTFVTFDRPGDLEAGIRDPSGFVTGYPTPLLIDEVQRAGDPLIRAIKAEVDNDPRPGRYVLAGSTRFLTVPTLSESLAGRAHLVDLWPLSQDELEGRRERFIDLLFSEELAAREVQASSLDRADYFERVCAGGFPEVTKMTRARTRAAWFTDYVTTVTQRDIREFSRLRQATELPRLLSLIAARSGGELNVSRLAADAGLHDDTTRNYLPLLETVYLFHTIPAWSRNLTSKVKRRPKIYLTDSGLAAHLVGASPTALALPTSAAAGQLLETFVVNELAKQRTWSEVDVTLFHYRDRAGPEVDVVIEARDGRVAGIEIKAARDVRATDFRWLELFARKLGKQFVAGIVLYTGSRPLPFGDRLTALPVSTLWALR